MMVGVESFIMNYYRNIDKTKVQFDFIVDSDSKLVPLKEIEDLGGRVIKVPPYQNIFKYLKETRKIFKENKYKIVHAHLNTLSIFPLFSAFLAKVPVRIAHSHSTSNKKEWKKNIIKWILRPMSKLFATNYFACSKYAGAWLFGKKALNKNQITIIKNAINLEKFSFNENVRNEIKRKLKIENKFIIGCVGRFMEQKNHRFLIDIFEQVHKEKENSVLLLIGSGNLEEEIKNKIKALNLEKCVYFLGVKSNVYDYMSAMDAFVLPSLYEGLGMVLIEAQVSGLKCFTSNVVPKEAQITNNIKFLPLDNLEVWKKAILEEDYTQVRKGRLEEAKLHNYDIKIEAEKLCNKYINLYCSK